VTEVLQLAKDRPFWWMITMADGRKLWLSASHRDDDDDYDDKLL